MLERFSRTARDVVVRAQDEAAALRHPAIGADHLLVAVAQDEGIAGRVLASHGIGADALRAAMAPGTKVSHGNLPYTPGANDVLQRALQEALSLGHGHIGAEHVLLALARVRDELDGERVRTEVLAAFQRGEGEPGRSGDAEALLALAQGSGPAADLLREHGITPDVVRQRLG